MTALFRLWACRLVLVLPGACVRLARRLVPG
jgi:hypothetical protein